MTLPARHRPGHMLERAFPWREPLTSELDEFFDRMHRFMETSAPAWTETMTWAPLADLRETDEAYTVECEVPGLKREDIDVEISRQEICISGELKEREGEGVLRRATRRTGRFEYRALLPADVKSEEVSASLTDGILTVIIPKAQAAKPRHIEITT